MDGWRDEGLFPCDACGDRHSFAGNVARLEGVSLYVASGSSIQAFDLRDGSALASGKVPTKGVVTAIDVLPAGPQPPKDGVRGKNSPDLHLYTSPPMILVGTSRGEVFHSDTLAPAKIR